jgi:integrase
MSTQQHRTTTPRRKRANGEGTIWQTQSGRSAGLWRAAVQMSDGSRRTYSGKTREEVEQKLLDARHAVSHNQPLPSRELTVGAYLTDWLADRESHLRPRTAESYGMVVRLYLKPVLGRKILAELQPPDVRKLHRELKAMGEDGKPLSARTVAYAHAVLRTALSQAERDGLVSRNVARLAPPPRAERPKVNPFSPTEALEFLKACEGDPRDALFVTTLGLGLRRGEVLGLRWSDIDFNAGTVRVAGQVQRQRNGGGLQWVAPKTRSSIAVLDAPAFVLDALRAHRDRQLFARGETVSTATVSEYVFPGENGPRDPDEVSTQFPQFLAKHGLRRTRFHDLRHATASLLLARGVPLWNVSKILRHATVSTTADIYGHFTRESSRQAADTMSAFMEQAK